MPTSVSDREKAVSILSNLVDVTFSDDLSINSACKDAVKAMWQAGIMMCKRNNLFNPGAAATRGEAAAILTRYVRLTIDPATAQGLAEKGGYPFY